MLRNDHESKFIEKTSFWLNTTSVYSAVFEVT